MKVIRVGQRCLLAALVLSAIACASASAASYEVKGLPEIGRCVKVPAGTGIYKGSLCITHETKGLGKWEWIPAAESEKLTFAATAGESVLITTGEHPLIKCAAAKLSGQYIGAKRSKVTAEFTGCKNSFGQVCSSNSLTAPGVITSLPLEGELGFIRNEVKEGKLFLIVGFDLRPEAPLTDLAIYKCSATETASLTGSVIGKIKPIDRLTTESNLLYATKSGGAVQQYEKFKGGLTDTLSTSFLIGTEMTSGTTTLKIVGELGKNSVPLEIKAKEN